MIIAFTVREIAKNEWIAKERYLTKFPFSWTKGYHVKRFLPIYNPQDIPDIATKLMHIEMNLETIDDQWQWRYVGPLISDKKPISDFMINP